MDADKPWGLRIRDYGGHVINTFGSNHFGFADKHMFIRGWEIHLSKMQGPSTSVNFLSCLVVWARLRYSFLRGAQLLILSRGSGLQTGSSLEIGLLP